MLWLFFFQYDERGSRGESEPQRPQVGPEYIPGASQTFLCRHESTQSLLFIRWTRQSQGISAALQVRIITHLGLVSSILENNFHFPRLSDAYMHCKFGYFPLTLNMRGPSQLGFTRSISWLLMPWLLASPGHQQPWYWLYRIGRFLSYLRKDFNCRRRINEEIWHKM